MSNRQTADQGEQSGVSPPVQVLLNFLKRMNQWEYDCWHQFLKFQEQGGDLVNKQSQDLQRMNEIFVQYCTPKNLLFGRKGSFRNPPEYDPATELVVEVIEKSDRKVVIYTQQESGFRLKNRYVMLFKEGKWMLDTKQWLRPNGKWEKSII